MLIGFQVLSAQGEEETYSFNIPEGIAVDTIRDLAHQTGVDTPVSDVPTNQIQGRYTVAEALEKMLQDTPLEAVRDSESGAYAIVRIADGDGRIVPSLKNRTDFTRDKPRI